MAFFGKVGKILRSSLTNHMSQDASSARPSIFQAIRCMSTSKLFIGGLSYNTDDTGLREAFDKYGEVAEARVIVDRETGRSRGFGFVTFTSVDEASAAIQALDQQDLHGRRIRVDYANDRARGYGGGGGGFRGGNFGGGYGGEYGGGGSGGGYGGGGYGSGSGGGYGGGYGGGGYGSNSSYDGGVAGGVGGTDGGIAGAADNLYATDNSSSSANTGYGGYADKHDNDVHGQDESLEDNYADKRN